MKNVIQKLIIASIFISNSLIASKPQQDISVKYEKWKLAVTNPSNAKLVFSFFYNNPHWPLFEKTVRIAEKHAKNKISKNMALKFFKRYPPKTKEGLKLYIDFLLEKQPEFAKNYIKQTWIFQNLSPSFMNKYRKEFSEYVSSVEDARKTKYLMNGLQLKQLEALKNIVIDEISDFISDFLEKHILSKSKGYSKEDLNDIDKKCEIIQSLIDSKNEKRAANILALSNDDEEKYATSFFNQRRHVAFNILRSGNPKLAYKVMSMYKMNSKKTDEKIARAEWLLGYISFRFLNNYKLAEKHFKTAFYNSVNSIRISKNAFWLAEVYTHRGDIILAIKWFKIASKYFSTFYGYLAEQRLKKLHKNNNTLHNSVSTWSNFTFHNRELVHVLIEINDSNMREYFYQQLIKEIDDPNEEMLLMDIAIAHDETGILITESSKRQHYFINELSYKKLNQKDIKYINKINNDKCFLSFIHSIIHRESNFDENAKSIAGAIGLMQIMPTTARYEAKRIHYYTGNSLYNRKNNIIIGASIINRLLKKYSGNLVYTAAAYNCGEGGVNKYKNSIKNLKSLQLLDIIELIPIKETRLYVKHVLRSMFAYQKKFGNNACYNLSSVQKLK